MLYLAVSLLSLILFILIAQWLGFDVSASFSEILSIGILPFIILFLITTIEFIAKTFRFKYALNNEYSFRQLAAPYLASIFISFLVPSRFAGEGIRPLAFRSNPKIPASECLSAISIERVFDVLFLPFLLFGAISSLLDPIISIALIISLILFLVISTTTLFIEASSLVPHKALSSFFSIYFKSLRDTISNTNKFITITALTVIIWLCAFLRLWLIIMFLDASLPFFEASSASAAAYLFSVLSILPGGGVLFEGGGTAALMFFGVASDKALSAMLVERFFAYWVFIIAGLAVLPYLKLMGAGKKE